MQEVKISYGASPNTNRHLRASRACDPRSLADALLALPKAANLHVLELSVSWVWSLPPTSQGVLAAQTGNSLEVAGIFTVDSLQLAVLCCR